MRNRLAPRLLEGVRFLTVPENLYQRALHIRRLVDETRKNIEMGLPSINGLETLIDELEGEYRQLCCLMISRTIDED